MIKKLLVILVLLMSFFSLVHAKDSFLSTLIEKEEPSNTYIIIFEEEGLLDKSKSKLNSQERANYKNLLVASSKDKENFQNSHYDNVRTLINELGISLESNLASTNQRQSKNPKIRHYRNIFSGIALEIEPSS